jgi:hypothetical protein
MLASPKASYSLWTRIQVNFPPLGGKFIEVIAIKGEEFPFVV